MVVAVFRYVLSPLGVLAMMAGLTAGAMAGDKEDCENLRAAAAVAACTRIAGDTKQAPGARAQALLVRARAVLDSGEFERAEADINAALALRPGFPFGYRLRGRLRGLQGRNTEALAEFSKAIKLSDAPSHKYISYIERGNFYLRVLDLTSAHADFDQAIGIDPTKASAYVGRALSSKASGKLVDALADLDRAKAVEPAYWLTLVERGDILLAEKRYADAIKDYDAALAIRPNELRAMRGRAAATALSATAGGQNSNSSTPAPAVAPPVVPSAPTPPVAVPTNQPSSPVKVVAPATVSPPAAPAAPAPVAPPLESPKTTPPATPAVSSPAPTPPPPSSQTADPNKTQQAGETSPVESNDAVDAAAKHAALRQEKLKAALELRKKSKHGEALAIYDALLLQAPADAEAAVEKGRTLMALTKWEDALKIFKSVQENKTASVGLKAVALEGQAEVLAVNNQFALAIQSATVALQLLPKLDRALFWRGYSGYQLGNFEAALSDLQQAVGLAPNSILYAGWEAMVHIAAGNLTKAKEAMERASAIQADHALVTTARARLSLASGDIQAAEAAIVQLSKIGPLSSGALETQQLIMIHKILKATETPAAPRP